MCETWLWLLSLKQLFLIYVLWRSRSEGTRSTACLQAAIGPAPTKGRGRTLGVRVLVVHWCNVAHTHRYGRGCQLHTLKQTPGSYPCYWWLCIGNALEGKHSPSASA